MFKSSKHVKELVLRSVPTMRMFWSFGFWSLDIVSYFVLRYSNFKLKEANYLSALFRGLPRSTISGGGR